MAKTKFWLLLSGCVVLLAGGRAPARAQGIIPDAPQLTDVAPPSAKRGTSVDLTLSGQRLAGATGFVCKYSAYPGMIAPRDYGLKGESVSASSDGQARGKLVIPADAPPGLHEVRLVTAQGVTTPAYFYVSQYDQKPEQEPNNGVNEANAVTLPVTMAGIIQNPNDQDCFAFTAKAGETIVFDVEGFKRFGPPQNQQNGISYLDSFISLLDVKGNELAYSDDDTRLDAFLAYKIPADGKYSIAIRDTEYRGRGDFHYRLTVAKRPTITAVFPPGGQVGSRATVTVFGYDLDGAGATTIKRAVNLPEQPAVQEFRITTGDGTSNSVPLVADAFAEAPEVEPNDRIQEATQVVVPCTCSGYFSRLDDQDGFRFQGQAGQRVIFQVMASKLGSPVDTVITLMTRGGTVIARDDDGGGMPDSRLDLTLPRTDEYVVFVRNQVRSGAGPQQFYRLSIRPPSPDFSASIRQDGVDRRGQPTKVDVDGLTVPQGGTAEFELTVNRMEGQNGVVTANLSMPSTVKGLKLEQLTKTPIEGTGRNGNPPDYKVTVEKGMPTVKDGMGAVPMRLTAAADAAPGTLFNVTLTLNGNKGPRQVTITRPIWITVAPK